MNVSNLDKMIAALGYSVSAKQLKLLKTHVAVSEEVFNSLFFFL